MCVYTNIYVYIFVYIYDRNVRTEKHMIDQHSKKTFSCRDDERDTCAQRAKRRDSNARRVLLIPRVNRERSFSTVP